MADYKAVKRPTHYKNTIASQLKEKESFEYQTKVHYLVFLLTGSVRVTVGHEKTKVFDAPTMFLVHKEKLYQRIVLEPSLLVTFPLEGEKMSLSLLSLTKEQLKDKTDDSILPSLPINEQFNKLLLLFSESFSFSFLNDAYYGLKLAELMYLVKTHLTEEDRIRIFSSIIDDDFLFSDFVLTNYKHVDNVKELVELSCYSLSGFEKKFKRVFRIPPSKWLKEQKRIAIGEDLYFTNKTLKQISSEYGFCSPTHFNRYCKTTFGLSPGEMRKQEIRANK